MFIEIRGKSGNDGIQEHLINIKRIICIKKSLNNIGKCSVLIEMTSGAFVELIADEAYQEIKNKIYEIIKKPSVNNALLCSEITSE